MDNSPATAKVVLIGNTGVGKTSIANAICRDEFASPNSLPTIGMSQLIYNFESDYVKLTIHFWDTAGQERFKSLTPSYLRGAHLCFVVFALNEPDSFTGIEGWVEIVRDYDPRMPIVLVGNKADLKNEVSTEEIGTALGKFGIERYHRTSAVTKLGIGEIVRDNIDLIQCEAVECHGPVANVDAANKCC
jgi:small GTP-binding protein